MHVIIGLIFFAVAPFLLLSLLGFSRALGWFVLGLIATVILGLGAILGFALSVFFMDNSYFKEMPIHFYTTMFIDSITKDAAWKFLLIPYVAMADVVILYFKISFFYKPNIVLWIAEAWTWLLCFMLIKRTR